MPAAQLQLATQGDDPRNLLRFACPHCGGEGSQRVGERATRLLGRAGIVLVTPSFGAVPATGATAVDGSALG